MATQVTERYPFSGDNALEQTTEFLRRIRRIKEVVSSYRSGNSVVVKLKDIPILPDVQLKLSEIHTAVGKWKPKRENQPRKSA